jgi:3-phenylpropionate/cinnamic acid dioxygenase small subunit
VSSEDLSDRADWHALLARQQIHNALMRYCWGIDRGDLELILSAFHADARDNHSGVEESAVERFTRTVVEGAAMRTSHNLGNILIQVEGDVASAQSYLTAWHQFEFEGQTYDWVLAGRYLDRFECRNGDWRIAHRTVVYELERFDGPGTKPNGHPAVGFFDHVIRGERSRKDYSFQLLRAEKSEA